MTAEQIARHALGSPYLDGSGIYIEPPGKDRGDARRSHDGTWFTCRVHIPDAEAQRVQQQDPYFPKDNS